MLKSQREWKRGNPGFTSQKTRVGGRGGGEQRGRLARKKKPAADSQLAMKVAKDKTCCLASAAALISIASHSRYNENCVWKQCPLQRHSGKKVWSGPVQLQNHIKDGVSVVYVC